MRFWKWQQYQKSKIIHGNGRKIAEMISKYQKGCVCVGRGGDEEKKSKSEKWQQLSSDLPDL